MKHVPRTLSEKKRCNSAIAIRRNEVYISHVAEKDEYFFSVFEQTKKDETAWFTWHAFYGSEVHYTVCEWVKYQGKKKVRLNQHITRTPNATN